MLRFKSVLGSIFISLLFLGFLCSSASATTLIVDGNGQLLGANNVAIDNLMYDVVFIDASANELFYNATSQSYNFTFTDSDSAVAASAALLEQVLLDGQEGYFDSIPGLTNGIESYFAYIDTPYEINIGWGGSYMVNFAVAANMAPGPYTVDDMVLVSQSLPVDLDVSSIPYEVFAVWTLSNPTTNVPEPTTLLLLGVGLLGFTGLSRKKHFNKA